MREIKFRVFDKEQNKFLKIRDTIEEAWQFNGVAGYGNIGILAYQIRENGVLNSKLIHDNERFKIEQFTGLYDKNGKEIYEGDIVRHTRVNNGGKDTSDFYPLKIKFKKDITSFVIDYDCCGWHSLTEFDASRNIVVIGNIYENQEL